jgi:condensation enzyme
VEEIMSIAESTEATAPADRIPLSLNQEFVCLFDQGDEDAPFGPHYHIAEGWRVTGQVDLAALRQALLDVVTRHEALRTVIVRGDGEKHQKIYPPSPPELIVRDLPDDGGSREEQAESLIRELEAGTIDPERTPFLKAVLARFDQQDSVLVLMTHHIATDGWSVRVLIRDLASRYAVHAGYEVPDLPRAPQYREFAAWQREMPAAETAGARAYWRKQLDGARISAIPTDFPRSAGIAQSTAAHRFTIPADVVSAVSQLASSTRSSKTMVMLAAYALVVYRKTSSPDMVIATFTPGRGGRLFQDSVGSFFNFIPLRIDVTGCRTFRDVLERVRKTCLDAYSNDIPTLHIFAESPELMGPAMSDGGAPAVFQVFPDPVLLGDDLPGNLDYAEIRRQPVPQPRTSATPDGVLWTMATDPAGNVIGTTVYKQNLFTEATIAQMAGELQDILRIAAASPGTPLELG